jgi:hypothetical protein
MTLQLILRHARVSEEVSLTDRLQYALSHSALRGGGASARLRRIAQVLAWNWQQVYTHPPYFLEIFVNAERFRGTCYRAAKRIGLGRRGL